MYGNYVLPTLQASILCEDVRHEINGIHTLVGVLNVIPAPQLPIGFFKLCLWTRWCAGLGNFQQTSRILAPDDQQVIAESNIKFELKDLESHATNVHFFGGIQLLNYGHYHVEIAVDETLMLRFPLAVVQVSTS